MDTDHQVIEDDVVTDSDDTDNDDTDNDDTDDDGEFDITEADVDNKLPPGFEEENEVSNVGGVDDGLVEDFLN